jgi:hypothetical protein
MSDSDHSSPAKLKSRVIPVIPIMQALQSNDAANAASTSDEPVLAEAFAAWVAAHDSVQGTPAPAEAESINTVAAFLDAAKLLDATYGADGTLPVAGADDAVVEALRAGASLQTAMERQGTTELLLTLDAILLGVGLWCMRHQLSILVPEPLVNALARRANAAESRQETAATFALMQGFVAHLATDFGSDLERSNPERPWRILNVNFAITAVRTGDAAMMRYAFDRLNAHLPDECAGFYAEAATLAAQPGFPVELQQMIDAELGRHLKTH